MPGKRRRIARCQRCKRVLFIGQAGYCTTCEKRVRTYGAAWAPMRPARWTVPSVVFAVLLFAQANQWDGSYQWATYEEGVAWDAVWKAQIGAYTAEHCGEQYLGTYCRQPDGTYGYAHQ